MTIPHVSQFQAMSLTWKTNYETKTARGMTSGLLFNPEKTSQDHRYLRHKQNTHIEPEGPAGDKRHTPLIFEDPTRVFSRIGVL